MSAKPSLADFVRESLSQVKDIDIFKDKVEKQKFVSELQKNSNFQKDSIRLTLTSELNKRIKIEGKNQNDFQTKQGKRFSSKLDLNVNTDKVEVNPHDKSKSLDEAAKDKKSMPALQNPKTKSEEFTIDNHTYESFSVAVTSIIGAFVDNFEELTVIEKESFGACLKFSFGDMIESSNNVRRLFGFVGISGILVGKIKKAKKITKAEKKKEALEVKGTTLEKIDKQTDTKKIKPIVPVIVPATKEEQAEIDKNNKKWMMEQTDR